MTGTVDGTITGTDGGSILDRVPSSWTYTNPVHPGDFPDPFVMRVGETYYGYATELHTQPPRALRLMRSDDLVHWTPLQGPLERLREPWARDYWAPEVAFHGGRFFMYYSAGIEDRHHQIRVATADRPDGPFRDTGRILTPDDPFTIDAHPFRDDDGQWYLYYSRDFLEGERVGTAIVVDRLVDMLTLAGERQTILRASADWQLFRKQREMYGAVYDWYTLEGPFLRKRDGLYYLFYSGGAWETENYGVSYAVADAPLGPFLDARSDAPALLRTIPGSVIGPGHASLVAGPDGDDYLVYHAWDRAKTARRMCIDRVEWTADGPRTRGPTTTPQPAPRRR